MGYNEGADVEGIIIQNQVENETDGVEFAETVGTELYELPEITYNAKNELTNGAYTLNQPDMEVHVNGRNPKKSQFLYSVDANTAVLDAAAYADTNNLWVSSFGNANDFANKAKIYVVNGPVGVTANGELTHYINVYRTKTGYIHGCPGKP